jgi:hypothetical protein
LEALDALDFERAGFLAAIIANRLFLIRVIEEPQEQPS